MESNPDMLAFVQSHKTIQQHESDSTTSPEPSLIAQQSTRSLTNSPPNSTNSSDSPAATMATDENVILAAQLASTVPVIDDKEERPSLSYKDLIIEAISSSPEQRLKLSEIYQVIYGSSITNNEAFLGNKVSPSILQKKKVKNMDFFYKFI